MFNVKEVIREVEADKNPESESTPCAKRANRAKDGAEIDCLRPVEIIPVYANDLTRKIARTVRLDQQP